MRTDNPSYNLLDAETWEAPTGLDRFGRSRNEAPGTLHPFSWHREPGIGPEGPTYWYKIDGPPRLLWFMRDVRDRLIEGIEVSKARLMFAIEGERQRFLGIRFVAIAFRAVHVVVSATRGRIDLIPMIEVEGNTNPTDDPTSKTEVAELEITRAVGFGGDPWDGILHVSAAGGQTTIFAPLA